MSGVNNINITLLKQYQSDFNNEKAKFDNYTYNTYKTSYIPKCQDYYVKQMSRILENLYDAIRNGYYNINIWWQEYNDNIGNAENSLAEQSFEQNEALKKMLMVGTQASTTISSVGEAVVVADLVIDTANDNDSNQNINDNDVILDMSALTGAASGSLVTTTLPGLSELWSSAKESINSAVDWTKGAINDTKAWVTNAWNSITNWAGNVKTKISNFLDSTGARISDAWESVKEFGNEVKETIKAAGATIANAVISLVKGLTSLIEAINDFALIVETGIASLGTLVVDGFNCLFNDQEGLVATSKLWRNTKETVAYSWTDTIFDNFYETDLGQWLDENAIGIFKSDGMGCQILEGIGYLTGVVILTVTTFGTATPLVLGGTAAVAGVGKYSESEWNKNYLTISYENGEQFNITLDYQQYKDLNQLSLTGGTREYTQTLVDENGNSKNITFTLSINENGIYDVYDNEGNKLNFVGLNESNTAKGLGMAAIYGIWEGIQYAAGAKIGTSVFSSLTSSISNPLIQKLAVSGIRIGLDTITGVVEVPFHTLTSMLSDDISWSQAWQNNGGWKAVLTQAGIASLGSLIGEGFELGRMLNQKNLSIAEDITPIKETIAENGIEPLANDIHTVVPNTLEENTLIKTAKDMVDEIFKTSDPISLIRSLSVEDSKFFYVLSEIVAQNDLEKVIKFFSCLDEAQFDYILSHRIIPSNNEVGRFINYTIDIYNEGSNAAQTLYNAFFKNFREHGIKHSTAVAEYAYNLAKSTDGLNLEEVLYAAYAHDYGMRGGFAYVDEKVLKKLIKANLKDLYSKDSILSIYDLEQFRHSIDSDDLIDQIVRDCHPLNSAVTVLTTKDLLPSGVDKNVVALLAMSHSKSTSGILHFSLKNEWLEAIDKLETTINYYNIYNNLLGTPNEIVFDSNYLRQLIQDPAQFARLEEEAWAIRDADAMAQLIIAKDVGTLMQDGTFTVILNEKPRMSYDEPVVGSSASEAQTFKDLVYNNDGTPKMSENGTQMEITNSISKSIHAGEMNSRFSSIRQGQEYMATVKFQNPNQYPISSWEAVKERLGEILTYTHINDKKFEIILPKECEGTQLAEYFQNEIKSYRNTIQANIEHFGIESIKNNQQNFLENILIIFE